MHAELFNRTRAECVAGGDEQGKVVLEEKKREFGKACGLADAIHADDGNNIGAGGRRHEIETRRRVDGRYRAKDVEGCCWGENLSERRFHSCTDGCFDAFEATC